MEIKDILNNLMNFLLSYNVAIRKHVGRWFTLKTEAQLVSYRSEEKSCLRDMKSRHFLTPFLLFLTLINVSRINKYMLKESPKFLKRLIILWQEAYSRNQCLEASTVTFCLTFRHRISY